MAVTVEDVRVRVTVDGAGGYDDLRDKQRDLEDQSKKTGASLDGLKAGLVNVAAALQIAQAAVGALAAAMGALKAPVDLAISFEREFALISTLSTKVGKDLEQGLLDLASRVPQSAADITKATYQAISAGIDPGNVVEFLDAASKAAVAGNTSLTESVEALTTSVNAFKSQGVTAARASDALFATVKAGVTTFGELNASLGQASAVATYGVSIEEVGAAVASLTKLGFSTSDAITRINAAVKAVAGPTGNAAKEFKRLGVEIGIERLQAVGLVGVLEDIQKATGGSVAEIAKLTKRFEGQQGLLGLLGDNYAGFRENLDATTGAIGATEAAFEKMAATTGGVIDNFKSTVEVTLTRAGQELLPTVTEAVLDLGKVVETEGPAMISAIRDIATVMAALIPVTLEAAAAFANFFTKSRETTARAEATKARGFLIDASAENRATGGADLAAVAAAAGPDPEDQRRALEDFAADRARIIAAQREAAQAEYDKALKEFEENQAVLDFTGGAGPAGRAAAAKRESLQSAVDDNARLNLEAASAAGPALERLINEAIDKVGTGAASTADLTPPGIPPPAAAARRPKGKRREAPVDLGGATMLTPLITPLQNAIDDAYGGVLAAAGAYGDFAAEIAAREERNAELTRLGEELAARELELIEDESVRKLAAMSLRHQAELEMVEDFEELRTRVVEVQTKERQQLEEAVSRSRRESVARDVAATIGGLADITEALGATGKAQSAFRAVALAADAIYHGIRGGGAQADAITAFAAGNIVQGIAFQAAAIQQFAASAQAASGAAKLAGGGGGGGGSRGGGGGGFAASRRATDDRQTDRPVRGGESQAPGLTIVISDAVPFSDKREIMEPMARSLADHVRRAMNTRAGARWPGAA